MKLNKLGQLKTLIGCLILLSAALPSFASTARAYGKSGTATTTNTAVTVTFNPVSLTVCNDGAVNLYVDFTDGVAVAADNSTNLIVGASECHSWVFQDKNVNNEFIVGLITGSSTAAYRLNAIR